MESIKEIVLGVDIGGSHITAALIDLNTRAIITGSHHRCTVDCNGTADEIITSWSRVICLAYQNQPAIRKRIGISMPGPFDYVQGICLIEDQEKFRSLFKLNLKNELAARLEMEPEDIKFLNDAAGFLQGEAFSGAARGNKKVIGITLGTGLGSAFYEDGVSKDAALWQSPFKTGIAEDYLSTRWFVNRYFDLTGQEIEGVKELRNLKGQDEVLKTIFKEFGNHLAEFLIPIIREQEADLVVLGGNIANAYEDFMAYLEDKLIRNKVNVNIKIAELQENASLLGAASCWELNNVGY